MQCASSSRGRASLSLSRWCSPHERDGVAVLCSRLGKVRPVDLVLTCTYRSSITGRPTTTRSAASMLASLAAHLRPAEGVVNHRCAAASDDGDPVVYEAEGMAVVAERADSGLSAEEMEEYERHGLVVPAAQLSPSTTAALQDLVVRTLAVTCSADPPVQMPIAPNCPTNLYGAHGPAIPADIAVEWMALCRHPAILDRVQSVLGPDIILWGNQLFHKPAQFGLEVPWQCVAHVCPPPPPPRAQCGADCLASFILSLFISILIGSVRANGRSLFYPRLFYAVKTDGTGLFTLQRRALSGLQLMRPQKQMGRWDGCGPWLQMNASCRTVSVFSASPCVCMH